MTTLPTLIVVTAVIAASAAVTIDNVAVRLGLPAGQGLSGVCLYRNNGPDKRQRVVFKSVGSTARKRHDGVAGDYMVAGDLAADRVYAGTFARLEDGDQVARFGCHGGQRFEIATPFVVPGRDLDAMLAVKESMRRRFGARQPSHRESQRSVTAEHVSVTLRGLRPSSAVAAGSHRGGDDAVTIDVFQLYKKPNTTSKVSSGTANVLQYSAYPYARYTLRHPVDNLMLADLPPDQMLAVKFRSSVPVVNENLTDNSIFVYTGGLYPRGTANLTRMLDELNDSDNDDDSDTDTAASSLQIDAKQAHHDSYGKNRFRIMLLLLDSYVDVFLFFNFFVNVFSY